jgi:hypothetical protein
VALFFTSRTNSVSVGARGARKRFSRTFQTEVPCRTRPLLGIGDGTGIAKRTSWADQAVVIGIFGLEWIVASCGTCDTALPQRTIEARTAWERDRISIVADVSSRAGSTIVRTATVHIESNCCVLTGKGFESAHVAIMSRGTLTTILSIQILENAGRVIAEMGNIMERSGSSLATATEVRGGAFCGDGPIHTVVAGRARGTLLWRGQILSSSIGSIGAKERGARFGWAVVVNGTDRRVGHVSRTQRTSGTIRTVSHPFGWIVGACWTSLGLG